MTTARTPRKTTAKKTTTRARAAAAGAAVPTDFKAPTPTGLPTITIDGVTYTARQTVEDAMNNFGVMRKATKNDLSGLMALVEAIFDDRAVAALDELDFETVNDLMVPIFEGVAPGN